MGDLKGEVDSGVYQLVEVLILNRYFLINKYQLGVKRMRELIIRNEVMVIL